MKYSKIINTINCIPFFMNERINVLNNLYMRDERPSCFLVSKEGSLFKVRLFSTFNPYAIKREAIALKYLRYCGLNWSPRIVSYKLSPPEQSMYLVESYLPGVSLDKCKEAVLLKYQRLISSQLCNFLKDIHQLRTGFFHTLGGVRFTSYFDMLLEHTKKHLFFLKHENIINDEDISAISRCFKKHKRLICGIRPTFLHFDLKPQNILLDIENKKIFIVDYEFARFGDPLHDIERLVQRSRGFDTFCDNILNALINDYLQENFTKHNNVIFNFYDMYYHISHLPYLTKIKDQQGIVKSKAMVDDLLQKLM